ncbi:MAG: DUF2551 domain-containing protein [Methanomicrobiales archaeon]|nr:DUF2551 domain-containing protein [Methanomicrobiales archaeon]
MRSPVDIKRKVYNRIKDYLSRDRTGLRRALLNLFIRVKSLTVPEIFESLRHYFSISYHSIASMVGVIASRLGILRVKRNPNERNSVYELKEKYIDIVRDLVTA